VKKLSPLSRFNHIVDNLRYSFFVVVFGVLFVEDTVGFVAKSDTSEEMGGVVARIRVINITISMRYNSTYILKTL
jgi:hypothetical protein